VHVLIDSHRLTGTGEYRVEGFEISPLEIHDIPGGASATLQLQNRRVAVRFRVGIPCSGPDEAELVVLDRLASIPGRGTVYFETGAGVWRKSEEAELRGHPLGYAGGFVFLQYEIEGRVPAVVPEYEVPTVIIDGGEALSAYGPPEGGTIDGGNAPDTFPVAALNIDGGGA